MEFEKVTPKDSTRWNKVWELYEASFPLAERRKIDDHIRACSDSQFSPISAWEGGELIGLLFYWEWDSYRYLEYLAVNPELRGHGFGSQLLRYLRDTDHTIILEIDPLINELSVRRLQFYERAGFTLTPYRFMHLPYRLESQSQELLILSYPKMITKEQHNDFLKFIDKRVILYCEGYPFE
ncbi:MAG: GNAT family N-acetyltransferase [Bacteroidia bacterium]|nr:GNAT family N-acetyltransferase [Bacteroidia bacterium]